jgi:nitrilase
MMRLKRQQKRQQKRINEASRMSVFAAIQMTSGADVTENLRVAGCLIEEAKAAGAQVVLLPENFNFLGMKDVDKRAVAEQFGSGRTQDFLSEYAKRHGLWIIGGTAPLVSESQDDRVTNTSLVYDADGRCVARYDKMHLFDVNVPGKAHEIYRESTHVAPGHQVVVVDTPAGRVGLSVCYDVRFPELYRQLSAQGAEIVVVPAAFTVPTGQAHWEVLLRARAIENLCYVVAAAQTGTHPNRRETYGDSLIVDWWGRVVTRKPQGSGIISAQLDLAALRQTRTEFPALSNRVL